jgi:hypothetical protein
MEHPSIELGRDGFLGKLKGAALSILLVLYASARNWGVRDLALVTGWSTVQVRRSLGKLHSLGWVEQHGRYRGWTLVTEARRRLQAWLQTAQLEAAQSQAGQPGPASALEERSGSLEVVNYINTTTSTDSDSPASAQKQHFPLLDTPASAQKQHFPLLDTPASAQKQHLPQLGTPASAQKQHLPQLDSLVSAQKQHLPPVADILTAAEGLFGEPVWEPPERYHDPQLLLAWIAHAYQMRLRLDKPARVVYSSLQAHRSPPQRYLDDPLAFLPQEFLVAAGLALPLGEGADPDGGDEVPPPQDMERAAEAQDPSLELLVGHEDGGNCSAYSAGQAWEQALALLAPGMPGGMPAGIYANWVAPAILLRYEPPPEPGVPAVFHVEVPGNFLRAVWLDRLVPGLCRQLSGFCAGEVAIQVEVADEPPGSGQEAYPPA